MLRTSINTSSLLRLRPKPVHGRTIYSNQRQTPILNSHFLSTTTSTRQRQHRPPPSAPPPPLDTCSKKPTPAQPTKSNSDNNADLPAFSFEGLGASRGVKIVVLTALGILGTMETVFYAKWIYHYLYLEQRDLLEDEGEEKEMVAGRE